MVEQPSDKRPATAVRDGEVMVFTETRRQPSLMVRKRLAKVLGVPLTQLLD